MGLVTSNSRVTLHFELSLDDGQVVDSNFGKTPVQFVFGDGNLLPAFEDVLLGMKVRDVASFVMLPEKAFGVHNENNVQHIPRSQFSMNLEEGMVVSFSDAARNELPGVIAEIGGQDVMVDFNHPLAGRSLKYRVQIVAIEKVV